METRNLVLTLILVPLVYVFLTYITESLRKRNALKHGVNYLTKSERNRELKKIKNLVYLDFGGREYFNITGMAAGLITKEHITAESAVERAKAHVIYKRTKRLNRLISETSSKRA